MFLIDPRLLQNTPGELSLTIREALGHISRALPYFINTTPMPGCVPLSCYGNVDRYVSQQGGCREEGWIVYEGWDGRYLKLIHHCLWRCPDGVLMDITPSDEMRNLFLPDTVRNQGQWVPCRYIPIEKTPEVAEIIEFCRRMDNQQNEMLRRIGDLMRRPNMRFRRTKSAPVINGLLRSKTVSRNDPCPCGSGRKFKKCCLR